MARCEKHLIKGPNDLEVPAHLHLGQYLIDKFKKGGNTIALQCGLTGKSITYSELLQQTINLAEQFRLKGLEKGDIVSICSEVRIEFMVAAIAIIFNGAIVNTINFDYTEGEMTHALKLCRPIWIITSLNALKNRRPFFSKHVKQVFLFENEIKTWLSIKKDIEDFTVTDVKGQTDTAVILFSSGTTGLPKAVELTHLNYLVTCKIIGFEEYHEERNLKCFLTVSPWFHTMGFTGTISYISARRTVVFLNKFSPEIYLKCMQDFKIDAIFGVPPIVLFLAKSPLVDKYDISSIKQISIGGATLSEELISEAKQRLGSKVDIIQGFGMTEVGYGVLRDLDAEKPASSGRPLPTCVLKVVDIETGKNLGPFQRGELRAKGGSIMKGYYNNPKATAEAFDESGFLKTGDVAYYDNDRFFYIVDRIKELIKYKGFQVPPAEVEAVLLEHPDIADCGVVGRHEELAGELPTAFVVKKRQNLVEKAVIDYVATKLSPQKRLHGGVIFVEAIPKNPSGKILRKHLREMLKKYNSKL